jgi:hypothetical protein
LQYSHWMVTPLGIECYRFPSRQTTGRCKEQKKGLWWISWFKKWKKTLFSYFLIPMQILHKSKKQVNFSRIKKFSIFVVSSNMLLILLVQPYSPEASQDLCLKTLSFCGFFLVIWCTLYQMVWSLLHYPSGHIHQH